MNSKSICSIIKACVEAKVSKIKLTHEHIEVEFFGGANQSQPSDQASEPETPPLPDLSNVPRGTFQAETLEQNERDPHEIDAEDELQELALTDPLEFESRLARGELVDAETEDA